MSSTNKKRINSGIERPTSGRTVVPSGTRDTPFLDGRTATGRTGRTGSGHPTPHTTYTPGTNPGGTGFGADSDVFNGTNYRGDTHGEGWAQDWFYPFLNSLLGGNGSIADMFGSDWSMSHSEQRDAMLAFLLQYANTIDQRAYDKQLTQDDRQYNWQKLLEQRLYDSPTNQLARLMGAGISRDAALQMLNSSGGSTGSGVAASPISNPAAGAPSVPAPSGSMELQTIQTGVAAACQIASTVGQLMNAGMSFAQGVESVQALHFQNTMNQEQLTAYKNVNAFNEAIQQMQASGILSQEDLDSWSNADDVYKWFSDHQQTNAVKPLYDSGIINGVFGNTIGRTMFNNDWHQRRDSRNYGTQLDQLIRQNELKNDLLHMDVQTSYITFNQAIYDLLMREPQLMQEWQQVELNGINYEIREFDRDIASNEAYKANVEERVSRRVFEDAANGGIGSGNKSGISLLSFEKWYALNMAAGRSLAYFNQGDKFWEDYFQNDVETAKALSFVRKHQSEFAANNLDTQGNNSGLAIILQLVKLMTDAGAWNAIDIVMNRANQTVDLFQ